jgi:hypothetical protein
MSDGLNDGTASIGRLVVAFVPPMTPDLSFALGHEVHVNVFMIDVNLYISNCKPFQRSGRTYTAYERCGIS